MQAPFQPRIRPEVNLLIHTNTFPSTMRAGVDTYRFWQKRLMSTVPTHRHSNSNSMYHPSFIPPCSLPCSLDTYCVRILASRRRRAQPQ